MRRSREHVLTVLLINTHTHVTQCVHPCFLRYVELLTTCARRRTTGALETSTRSQHYNTSSFIGNIERMQILRDSLLFLGIFNCVSVHDCACVYSCSECAAAVTCHSVRPIRRLLLLPVNDGKCTYHVVSLCILFWCTRLGLRRSGDLLLAQMHSMNLFLFLCNANFHL